MARGETGSDVDLRAAFDEAHWLSLVDVVGLEQLLEELLGANVDLVQEGTLKDGMWQRIEQEAVRAFERSASGLQDMRVDELMSELRQGKGASQSQVGAGLPFQYHTIRSTVGGVAPISRNRVAFWPRCH